MKVENYTNANIRLSPNLHFGFESKYDYNDINNTNRVVPIKDIPDYPKQLLIYLFEKYEK